MAIGPGGIDDYSQWQLTVTPYNSSLQEGKNNITASYSSIDNPALNSYDFIIFDMITSRTLILLANIDAVL